MKNIFKLKIVSIFVLLLLLLTSCEERYLNPSTVSQEQAVADANSLIALCNGLQYRYTNGRTSPIYSFLTANGLSTRELDNPNAGNNNEDNLRIGGISVISNNTITTRLWEELNLLKSNAQIVLDNTAVVTDNSIKAAIIAHASIYKALALGNLGTFFEKAPIAVSENAVFNTRIEVLNAAIVSAKNAVSALQGVTIPAAFTSRTSGNINYINTANALIARYYLMLGDNANALAFANLVPNTFKSQVIFDQITGNPIFVTHYSNTNVCRPFANLGLPASLAVNPSDGRLPFHLKIPLPAGANLGNGFFNTITAPIPFYTPGEIALIKAEAYARLNDLPNATTFLNSVLTKTAAADLYGVGANLPAYSGAATQAALLDEIYKNRKIELFMLGLSLEDSRRFGRPGPGVAGAERTRNFYPYPLSEFQNNPNTPPNPAN